MRILYDLQEKIRESNKSKHSIDSCISTSQSVQNPVYLLDLKAMNTG